MPKHKVGTREEWSAARTELLQREQELGNLDEELAKQRQELPWVTVEKEYTFDTEEGKKTLACSDLVLRHGLPLLWVSQMGPVGGSKLIARRKVAHDRGAAVEVA